MTQPTGHDRLRLPPTAVVVTSRPPFVRALKAAVLTVLFDFAALIVVATNVATSDDSAGVFPAILMTILFVFGPASVVFAITLCLTRRRRLRESDEPFTFRKFGDPVNARRRRHYYRPRHIAALLLPPPPPRPKHRLQDYRTQDSLRLWR